MGSERTHPFGRAAERYYITEHVRIRADESADDALARAAINEKLRRGWRLVAMVPGPPGAAGVELTWDPCGG